MSIRIYCSKLTEHIGEEVLIQGWVHRIRKLGAVSFIMLRDRTGLAQVVTKNADLKIESVVSIRGRVLANEKAPQGVELEQSSRAVLSVPETELPISVNMNHETYGLEVLLNQRLLSLRNPKLRAVFEAQSFILQGFSQCLREKGFYEIKTSKLINTGTEGGTGLFGVRYFDTEMYLSQSPQFYKQAAVAMGLEKVFEIGAAYRAEKHETKRHLNEYVSLDVELGFIDSLEPLIELERDIMSNIVETLKQNCSTQLAQWNVTVPEPEQFQNVPALSYDEARNLVSQHSGRRCLELDPAAEKSISDWAAKNYNIAAAFVYGYPRRKRPFYTMPDGTKTKSFDFIFNGVELSSGGLRMHTYKDLEDSARQFAMNVESLKDYLSIFRHACPPHGGFALGLERITQKILGIDTIKLASMFPRDRNRVKP